jgi:LPP20 lipoprotein
MGNNMSKKSNMLLISVVALGLAACAAPAKKEVVAECVFPNSEKAAPLWVCDGPVEGVAVSAVGSFPKSAAGTDFMKQQAATSARVKLAQQMKVHVQNSIKQYAETTGAGDKETVDQVYTATTKQITDQTLVGTKIFRSAQGPDGAMYVLLGMDEASTQKLTESALKTSMNNEKALWQKFQAGKAQDEMAADIAKMKAEAAPK